MATMNELPPFSTPQDRAFARKLGLGRTDAEIAAAVTPFNFSGVARPWVDVTTRYGLVGDDSTDNTAGLASALLVGGRNLFIRKGTYRTGKLTIRDDTLLYLEPGTIIKDVGVLGSTDRLINITNDRIHIIGWCARIQGNRAAYSPGEQRHNIYIVGASDVCIEGLASNGAAGDGYYIGAGTDPATNVRLIGCKGDDNRRQGLSLVSGRYVRIVDFEGTNTNGTAPAAGIDIEPNGATDVLEDIKIVRPRCIGNDGPGIEIFLSAWNSASNYADIDILEPYTSDNGAVSQSGRLRPGIDINRIGSTTPCGGRIKIIDAVCVDEQQAGIHIYDWDINGPLVEIIRPTVINPNQANGSISTINGGIILHNSGNYTTAAGNVRISEPLIRDDDTRLSANSLGVIRISGLWTQTDIRDPRFSIAGANPWVIDAGASPRLLSQPEILSAQTGNVTITDGRYLGRTITTDGAVGTQTITLIQATAARVGWRLSFALMEAQELRIDPNAADRIVPTGAALAAGTYIAADTRGSRLVLECHEAGFWDIVEQTGDWSMEGNVPTPAYTETNVTTDRAFDADTAAVAELSDIVGTLIKDLRAKGLLG